MKIIHTADLHLGQVIYQNYDRVDEHDHFFTQLESWCREEKPDALLVSGDVFDIQQPSAAVKKAFNDRFVNLSRVCPEMRIVITAGNHDSASRIQADSSVWETANTTMIGTSPSIDLLDGEDGWQDKYIVKLDSGYIIAMPYMIGERTRQLQSILDRVAADNKDNKPVVMMGHLAVTGMDATGHDSEIGRIVTQNISALGQGYDYLALGHIHKPQTIGHQEDALKEDVTYPSGVARYSGSALHVSCDEAYPHTVSVVTIAEHGGDVNIRQKRIDELRHFYVLPEDGSSFEKAEDALAAVESFARTHRSGYIRLRIAYRTDLPSNFSNSVYDVLRRFASGGTASGGTASGGTANVETASGGTVDGEYASGGTAIGVSSDGEYASGGPADEIRFNPKHLWTGVPERSQAESSKPTFEVADLQQMKDPCAFIEKILDQFPDLDMDMVREAFDEVKAEIERGSEEKLKEKAAGKATKSKAKATAEATGAAASETTGAAASETSGAAAAETTGADETITEEN